MKTDVVHNKAVMGNISEVKNYGVNLSAAAFDILSSGVYSDNITAIIRELSCNAYDSHVVAGNPEQPFDLFFPTTLEPVFYIRDYGTGLSHEDVMSIFTTYFDSSKQDSNDFIGEKGIGSKTPFSYTDNYTVQSYQNGKANTYINFINDEGFPCITHVGESETDEPNGLKISFAVKNKNDFYSFKQKGMKTLRWFKTKPNILGDSFDVPDVTYVDSYTKNVHNRGTHDGLVCLMGNIAYDVNPKELGLPSHIISGIDGFVVEVEIGDIHTSASRETVRYSDKTISCIKNHIMEAAKAVEEKIKALEFEDVLDMKAQMEPFLSHGYFVRGIAVPFIKAYKYKDVDIAIPIIEAYKYKDVDIEAYNKIGLRKDINKEVVESFNAQFLGKYNGWGNIIVTDETKVILNKGPVGIGNRLQQYNKNKPTSEKYLGFNRLDRNKEIDYDGLIDYLVLCDVEYDDVLPVRAAKNQPRTQGNIYELGVNGYGNHTWREVTEREFETLKEEDHLYVALKGWTTIDTKSKMQPNSYSTIFRELKRLEGKRIFGVRKSAMHMTENWSTVDDFIKNVVEEADFTEALLPYEFKNLRYLDIQLPDDLKKLQGAKYERVCTRSLGIDDSVISKFAPKAEEIKKKYPLIEHLSVQYVPKDVLQDYINQCNEESK